MPIFICTVPNSLKTSVEDFFQALMNMSRYIDFWNSSLPPFLLANVTLVSRCAASDQDSHYQDTHHLHQAWMAWQMSMCSQQPVSISGAWENLKRNWQEGDLLPYHISSSLKLPTCHHLVVNWPLVMIQHEWLCKLSFWELCIQLLHLSCHLPVPFQPENISETRI